MRWAEVSDLDERTIGHALRAQADSIGDAVFLRDRGGVLTFQAANDRVNDLALGLQKSGVVRGDRVALLMENSIDMASVALAVNKIGAVFVPINTLLKGTWLADAVMSARPALVVADGILLDADDLTALAGMAPIVLNSTHQNTLRFQSFQELGDQRGAEPDVSVSYRDASAVMWTSGTTGRPKGVVQTHSAWLTATTALTRSRDAQPGDTFYCCIPMFNSGGWSLNVFAALVSGTTVAIEKDFSASQFWPRCKSFGATQIITLGAMYQFLTAVDPSPADTDHEVRVCAAIPIPSERLDGFKKRFQIPVIWTGYAQSELMFMTACDLTQKWKPGSSGVAGESVELAILDDDDRRLNPYDIGEICVRTHEPYLMFEGYFDDPAATATKMRNLWFHTGDSGYLDSEGELFFTDRNIDLMRFGGRSIAASDVEKAASTHAAVAMVAAYGIAAEHLDSESEPMLAVVLNQGEELAPETLARYINDTAPYYLVPRYIEVLDELPVTTTGKVDKGVLRSRGVTEGTWDRTAVGFVVDKGKA